MKKPLEKMQQVSTGSTAFHGVVLKFSKAITILCPRVSSSSHLNMLINVHMFSSSTLQEIFLIVCKCYMQVSQEYTLIMGGLRASRKLHARLLERVMRLPMSFFDSQPSGRLLNRFTKDTESIDTQILVRAAAAAMLK